MRGTSPLRVCGTKFVSNGRLKSAGSSDHICCETTFLRVFQQASRIKSFSDHEHINTRSSFPRGFKVGSPALDLCFRRRCIEKQDSLSLSLTKGLARRSRVDSDREMSQLHVNILKLLQEKKNVKISVTKARKLRDALKKLHEDTVGCGQESASYFSVSLQNQQQETSSLTNAPVPHFLEAVTKYILENHATQEGLLRKNGNERRASRLTEVMEKNGAQIPPGEYSVHDVTCVLKRWLRCLPEPVVPRLLHDVFAKCVELESSHHHRTQALLLSCLLLPTFHLNTLKHVAVFLREIAKNDSCNKMTSANLAKVLAPSLMPRCVKVETDPELAKKFSDLSTIAIQVLIDNASHIGVLPPEYEALRESRGKDFLSEDDLSDHETERHSKKKLFTFLKSKGTTGHRASVLRTPQLQSKRMPISKLVPQSCPPKMSKAKKNTPPPHKLHEIVRSSNNSAVLRSLHNPFSSPPLQNEGEQGQSIVESSARVTRSNSRKQGEEAAKLHKSREAEAGITKESRRRLERNNASVRSLPAHSSQVMTRQQRQRASVRRAATVRAAMKYSYTQPAKKAVRAVGATSPVTAKPVKTAPRGSLAVRCSPRKPPRLSRQNDATGKGLSTLPQLTVPALAKSEEDISGTKYTSETNVELSDASPMDTSERSDVDAAAERVAASIEKLSMTQRKSPRLSGRRSSERRKSSSAGVQEMETSNIETDEIDGHAVGDSAQKEDDDFVLRTVKEDQSQVPAGSSLGEIVTDNFGTCVDSEDEGHNFVNAEVFMQKLNESKRREDDHMQFTPTAKLPDTPARSDVRSPTSARESVIAIRMSRAGFVRRNVREIESNFATPVGCAVRTRRQNTPGPAGALRLELANNNELTPISERTVLSRNTVSRRPLTPANAKRTISSRFPGAKGQLGDTMTPTTETIDV